MAKIYDDSGSVLAEVCSKCYQEELDNGTSEAEIAATMDGNGQDRHTYGYFSGFLCDKHWRSSGFVNAKPGVFDPFSPDYAGESLDGDEG